jgi:transcriptional regulator with XRE-family HTH domain
VRLENREENAQNPATIALFSRLPTVKTSLQDRVRQRLRRLVEDGDVSHETLGKYVGLSRSAITRMVNADAAISLYYVEKFCEFFQITPAEFMVEPGSLIQPVAPLEAQLLMHFRAMTDLQRHSLLSVLDRREGQPQKRRASRLGHAELTEEQQLVIDLYARSEPQAREGVLKVLRGTAKAHAKSGRSPSAGTNE